MISVVPEFLHSSSLRFSLDGPETMASPAPLLLLRVKRKATETPVEAIEVTGGSAKRRKTASAVFRLKSEDKKDAAATASPRKRKNVGPGGDAGGKEERKRFKVVQADGDAK